MLRTQLEASWATREDVDGFNDGGADGVPRLDSEDMQHGADIDGVKIINPFKA